MIKEILISFIASLSGSTRTPLVPTPPVNQEIIETQTEYSQALRELEDKKARLEELLVEKEQLEKVIKKQQKRITDYLDKKK